MLDVIEMDWQADMGVHQVEEKNLKMDISEIQLQRSEVANCIYQLGHQQFNNTLQCNVDICVIQAFWNSNSAMGD